jgi:hypothetical protein
MPTIIVVKSPVDYDKKDHSQKSSEAIDLFQTSTSLNAPSYTIPLPTAKLHYRHIADRWPVPMCAKLISYISISFYQ